MNAGKIKRMGKSIVLAIGLYRPARYLSDRLTNPVGLKRIADDTRVYKAMLKPDALCFDIGANVGAKSFSMLSAGGRVVAFEPQPHCVKEIWARCQRFGTRLQICEKALGSEPGTMILHSNETHDNYASFYDDWEGDLRIDIPVEITTFDLAIQEFGKPDYCKIDVEGWEYEVLSGLNESIPLVSFEYHLSERELETTRKCINRLSQFNNNRIELNIAESETSKFAFDEWLTEEQFWAVFPHQFYESPGFGYGDVWVRSL